MDLFNRLVVIILAVCVAACSILCFLASAGVASPALVLYLDAPARLMRLINELPGVQRGWLGGISLSVLAGGLVLLLVELAPLRRKQPILLEESPSGTVTIDNSSLCLLLDRTLRSLPGVNHSKSRVGMGAEGLIVHMIVGLEPDVSVVETVEAAREHLAGTVKESLGLQIRQIMIETRLRPTPHPIRVLK